jgi:hypothetical protein
MTSPCTKPDKRRERAETLQARARGESADGMKRKRGCGSTMQRVRMYAAGVTCGGSKAPSSDGGNPGTAAVGLGGDEGEAE